MGSVRRLTVIRAVPYGGTTGGSVLVQVLKNSRGDRQGQLATVGRIGQVGRVISPCEKPEFDEGGRHPGRAVDETCCFLDTWVLALDSATHGLEDLGGRVMISFRL